MKSFLLEVGHIKNEHEGTLTFCEDADNLVFYSKMGNDTMEAFYGQKLYNYFLGHDYTDQEMRKGIYVFDHIHNRIWACRRKKNDHWIFRCHEHVLYIRQDV